MSWILEIEAAQNIDDLRTSYSTSVKYHYNFDMLHANIATSLKKILDTYDCLEEKVHLEEKKTKKRRPISSGSTDRSHDLRTFSNRRYSESFLVGITLSGNDVQGFDATWDEVLLSFWEAPKHITLRFGTIDSVRSRCCKEENQ